MRLNKDFIKATVGETKCPQGECAKVAQEMVDKLLASKCKIEKEIRCYSLEDALRTINELLTEDALLVMWPNSGFMDATCNCPVWHSYIVFDSNPLQSFSAWESGLVFYDEKDTKGAIEKTINSEKHNNVITIHKYGRNT
jgi:hypothetical protein